MADIYAVAPAALKKLQLAQNLHTAVYIYGSTGYGKSRLVREFTKDKDVLWVSSSDHDWTEIDAAVSDHSIDCIVVDDLQQIQDDDRIEELISLIDKGEKWLIMIGRMASLPWMLDLIADGRLIVIPEKDLRLGEKEVRKLCELAQVKSSDEDILRLVKRAEGNACIIQVIIRLIKSGETYGPDMDRKIELAFSDYIEDRVISQWSASMQDFLMQLCVVDEFTLPLAVTITGDDQAAAMISEAMKTGNFLTKDGEIMRMRPILVRALRNRALKVFGLQKYNRHLSNAALYYAMNDDVLMALKLYEASGNTGSIRQLLIRNGRRHPGAAYYYQLKRYYLALPDEEIENSPVLMGTMSMLYSIMMNVERSEYWYGRLKSYAAGAKGGNKKEAGEMLIYLDIGLPHRGSVNILNILPGAVTMIKNGGLKLPEFSLTNNQPSVMNGGKDFCSWSKKDQLLADTVGKMIEKMLGKFGRGLIHCALCESFYEKGGRDAEVTHHAMVVQMEVEGGGKTELLFAAVGIQVRLGMISGTPENAEKLLDAFEERAIREGKEALKPCIAALRCRIRLMRGDMAYVNDWMASAPDEVSEFWALERYRYMTKVMCYLAQGRNTEAISLLEKLRYYADVCQRTYIRMESGLLLAIARKREKMEWQSLLLETLKEIEEYAFVRIISEKGQGILPLLRDIKMAYLESKASDADWFERVLKETAKVAQLYPAYMNCETAQLSDFSEVDMLILRMQAEGKSIKEIAAMLDLSERTVKYHAAENYRKLNAKGKTDAVQKAKKLNLI